MRKGKQYIFEVAQEVPYDITGIQIGYQVRKKLYEGKSAFQRVEVYNLMFFGRTLFLDGVLQTAEQDEFIYHEMLCQAPLFLHPSLGNVLIIGGGDGGALREVLKHRSVKKAVVVEIDGKVVKLSRKYLPFLSKNAFSDKRTKLVIEDGKKFIKKHKSEFDVIILDLSDPNGPSKDLISLPFYKNIKQALRSNGIVSVQSGSFITQPKLVSTISKRLQKVFSHVQVRKAVVPSYYAGEYIFTLASDYNFSKVTLGTLAKRYKASKMRLKYWSPEIHQASSVLPLYLKQELK